MFARAYRGLASDSLEDLSLLDHSMNAYRQGGDHLFFLLFQLLDLRGAICELST